MPGTLILAVSIIVWAGQYYPHDSAPIEGPFRSERAALEGDLESPDLSADERDEFQQRAWPNPPAGGGPISAAELPGPDGQWIEPAVRPLGWDWRIGWRCYRPFPAREAVMGRWACFTTWVNWIGHAAGSASAGRAVASGCRDETGERVYNIPVALSIMVFFALVQCASTLAVIRARPAAGRGRYFHSCI